MAIKVPLGSGWRSARADALETICHSYEQFEEIEGTHVANAQARRVAQHYRDNFAKQRSPDPTPAPLDAVAVADFADVKCFSPCEKQVSVSDHEFEGFVVGRLKHEVWPHTVAFVNPDTGQEAIVEGFAFQVWLECYVTWAATAA